MQEGQFDSIGIFNDELCSCYNIINIEQRVLALANNWWKKTSDNNNGIRSFTYHH